MWTLSRGGSAEGEPATPEAQTVTRIVLVEKSSWYSMLVATPSKTNGPWDYLMDVRMEKLIP